MQSNDTFLRSMAQPYAGPFSWRVQDFRCVPLFKVWPVKVASSRPAEDRRGHSKKSKLLIRSSSSERHTDCITNCVYSFILSSVTDIEHMMVIEYS